MEPPRESVLRIGDLRVDPALDEICKDGSTIKVEPRTMRLLLCLAEHAGQVVSVDQLLAEVWKDVIVGPDSVYQAVAGLRRILGDDPKDPVYIANVMRRGYRLVAPVAQWSDLGGDRAASPLGEAADPVAAAPRSPYLAPAILAFTVLTLVVGGVLSQRLLRSAHPAIAAGAGKSVAVLPFLDLSEKKDEEYFADGMSEELIDVLASVPELHVPARTSSFYFKGKQATLAEIAKALSVAHVLEGSVRKSGDTLRITAQLIQVDTGYNVWSQTFDRPMEDVFKVQDEIAAAVVSALKLSLLPSIAPKAARTANTAAYTLYLKARSIWRGNSTDDYEVARKYLQQTLILDPHFAAGWADFAQVQIIDLEWHDSRRSEDTCNHARSAADEALRLDAALPDAHLAKARILGNCDWNWGGAEAEYKRALELDPNNASALRSYAFFSWNIKRPHLALELAEKAVLRDPLDEWSYEALAYAQGANGKFAEAEASYRKALELDPTGAGFHALLANGLSAEGKHAAALDELEREPDEQFRDLNYPLFYAALGRQDDATRAIKVYETKYGDKDPLNMGLYYACRKDADQAIAWLTRTVAIHGIFADVAPRAACLKNLDHDPRYRALLRKINMPE
jgi:TolB-like protein/DNA-binding winged helix-turn-helix (wHTH) protein/Tfp pilus assembly protein PilF